MVGPSLYNMVLYCSFLGRRERWDLPESEYNRLSGAFGRMPIVIHLGDFLQLKPTGSGMSLITNLEEIPQHWEVPAEHQSAMKLFMHTPLCFELLATSRFKGPLRDLMAFMRNPSGPTVPRKIADSWQKMLLRPNDQRLKERRFQVGHTLAIYWDTVARCMTMRARRDAEASGQVLYLIQAADTCTPHMPPAAAKKLMNKVNPERIFCPVHVLRD